jgi:hypothetical protein
MAAITEREEMSDITELVISSNQQSIKSRVDRMRTQAKSRLKDLRGLLGGDFTDARTGLLAVCFVRNGSSVSALDCAMPQSAAHSG